MLLALKKSLLFGFEALFALLFLPFLNCWTASFGENIQIIKRQTPIEVDEVSYVPGIKDAKPKIDPKKFMVRHIRNLKKISVEKSLSWSSGDSTLPQNLLSQTSYISKTLSDIDYRNA